MTYFPFTNVPNVVFDSHLKHLGYAELKVLLVIIRQTYGWKAKNSKGHKERDWISRTFFVKKTGLSKRAVSKAIADLLEKQLIVVTAENGRPLSTPESRRHRAKLYFSCNLAKTSYLNSTKPVTKSNPTIIKHTKQYREEKSLGLQKVSFKYRNHSTRNNKETS